MGIPGLGSVWTRTAIDADTKLIASWLVGSRDAGSAYEFMQDVAGRLRNRVQLTTDGHRPYLEAVEAAFGMDAQLVGVAMWSSLGDQSSSDYSVRVAGRMDAACRRQRL
jgi:hypothetical protein